MLQTLFEKEYSEVTVLNSSHPDYKIENELFFKAAEQGVDADDCYIATYFMSVGNIESALKWYLICAEKGNKISQNSTGWCYSLLNQQESALFWFKKSADQKYHVAQYELGKYYLSQNDTIKAFYWLMLAANQNNANAQYEIALFYQNNLAKHRFWLTRASENGHAEAQYKLGLIYENEGNENKSLDLFSEAASFWHVPALWKIGLFYFSKGKYSTAKYYFNKLVNLGQPDANIYLGMCQSHKNNHYTVKLALFYLGLEKLSFIKETIYCCVCLETVHGALELKCKHSLCCECAYEISKSNYKRCPLCRGNFN